ncbi:hypothetical protein HYALB_00009321 [Hymenoscyphus albidus]|uniref:Uncharacterized protein n=1 Tax=Hymenoscyphus albidus TaxID=595503 RepID=A0A9N9Q705_9HELO|nr:hypothetical protein HYALB_00009321 [Hymenoscyphus albidus]
MPIQNHFGEAHSHLGSKSSIFLEKELPSPPSYEATMEKTKYVTWGVNWVAPGRMVGLMFGGLAFATGHHVFYTSLDGKEVTTGRGNDIRDFTTQEWMIGYGTAFAFLAKTAMAAAVAFAFAYKEHIWTTMKKKPVSIAMKPESSNLEYNCSLL